MTDTRARCAYQGCTEPAEANTCPLHRRVFRLMLLGVPHGAALAAVAQPPVTGTNDERTDPMTPTTTHERAVTDAALDLAHGALTGLVTVDGFDLEAFVMAGLRDLPEGERAAVLVRALHAAIREHRGTLGGLQLAGYDVTVLLRLLPQVRAVLADAGAEQ